MGYDRNAHLMKGEGRSLGYLMMAENPQSAYKWKAARIGGTDERSHGSEVEAVAAEGITKRDSEKSKEEQRRDEEKRGRAKREAKRPPPLVHQMLQARRRSKGPAEERRLAALVVGDNALDLVVGLLVLSFDRG